MTSDTAKKPAVHLVESGLPSCCDCAPYVAESFSELLFRSDAYFAGSTFGGLAKPALVLHGHASAREGNLRLGRMVQNSYLPVGRAISQIASWKPRRDRRRRWRVNRRDRSRVARWRWAAQAAGAVPGPDVLRDLGGNKAYESPTQPCPRRLRSRIFSRGSAGNPSRGPLRAAIRPSPTLAGRSARWISGLHAMIIRNCQCTKDDRCALTTYSRSARGNRNHPPPRAKHLPSSLCVGWARPMHAVRCQENGHPRRCWYRRRPGLNSAVGHALPS